MRVVGGDISLNHGALVEITDGRLTHLRFATDIVGSVERGKGRGFRIPVPPKEQAGRQAYAIARLEWWESFLTSYLVERKPDYVGVEDYALRQEQGAHQLGEIGGLVRLLCWKRGVPLRLHDPTTVKMFIAHNGNALKPDVEAAVAERWGLDFGKFNPPLAKPTKKTPEPKENRQTSEDCADAYGIAQMVWTEVQLRQGRILFEELHEKEIQAFNRITKANPTSLLSRDWIVRPAT